MNGLIKTILLPILFVVQTIPTKADLYSLNYTEAVRNYRDGMTQVVSIKNFSLSEVKEVETIALSWIYVGPCMGKNSENNDAHSTITTILQIKPDNKINTAIFETIMILTRENLGRQPSNDLCRFAYETIYPKRKYSEK